MLSCFVVNPITTHVIDHAGVSSSDLSYVQLANLLSQYLMDNPSQYLFVLPAAFVQRPDARHYDSSACAQTACV